MWMEAAGYSLLETVREEQNHCFMQCCQKGGDGPKAASTWKGQGRAALGGEVFPLKLIHPKLQHPLEGTASPGAAHHPARAAALLTRTLNTSYLHFSNANGEEDEEGSSFLQETQLPEGPCSNPFAATAKPCAPAGLGRV